LKTVLKSDDKEAIEKKTEALAQASAAIAQRAYAANQPPDGTGAGAPPPGADGGAGSSGAGAKPEENVVDAEFEEVRDKGRRAS
jgi:molecular chaperone DnaK